MPSRTWLITGASSGFGRELTRQLLAAGDEPAADVTGHDPVVGLVDPVGVDHLDFGADPVLAAEVEHLLGLGDAADPRPAISCPGTSGYSVWPHSLRAWATSEWQMPR